MLKRLLIAAAFTAMTAASAAAQGIFPPLINPTTPNVAGLAFGGVPDYLGADEYFYGAAPVARYQFRDSERYAFLYGNFFGANILDHPWLRTGPTAIYRFGRDEVEDPVVDRMADIDDSLDLGWTIGAEYIDPGNIARRIRLDLYASADVTGAHDGLVAGGSVTAWTPTPFMLLGVNAGLSWGDDNYTDTYFSVDADDAGRSGLPLFEAGGGMRDARLALVGMIPLGESWVVGAGAMYSRLLGDAKSSPIVAERGSADQFLFGFGLAYAW